MFMVAYVLFIVSVLLAISAYFIKFARLSSAGLSMFVMGLSVGLHFSEYSNVGGLLLIFFSIFQIFNIARLIERRLHEKFLKNAFLKGGSKLLGLQFMAYLMSIAFNTYTTVNTLTIIIVLQAVTALMVLVTVIVRLFLSRPNGVKNYLTDKELPSISVLVPARNEDKDLEDLLTTLVANDYPKLEILVLDDCSTGKNIPEIVKKFAHDGVRFVQGDMPSESWLPKNQAYKTLFDHSSGEWLIFMGVDVRLGVGSLRALINYALLHKKDMISVLPRRFNAHFWAGFASPLRHFRELIKINYNKRNTSALSTLWLISRDSYESCGGFESVSRKVVPEHYFAGELNKKKSYAFVRTDDYLQVSTAKKLSEQLSTSIRVIFPSLHRRMERVALSTMFIFVSLVLPFILSIYFISVGKTTWDAILVHCVCIILTSAHALVISFTNPIIWPLSLINLPYVALQEIVLSYISMFKYEFGEIYWKGRNVCLPVMHVVPRLPKVD
jgi:glycosyltransferase involved in cell wall biosynthesis